MGVSIVMGVPPVITPVLWDVPFINRGTSIYGTLHIGFPKHHGGKTIAELQSWPGRWPFGTWARSTPPPRPCGKCRWVDISGRSWRRWKKCINLEHLGKTAWNMPGKNHENSWRRLGKGRSSKDGDAESVLDCGIVDASSIPRNMRKLLLPLGSYIWRSRSYGKSQLLSR